MWRWHGSPMVAVGLLFAVSLIWPEVPMWIGSSLVISSLMVSRNWSFLPSTSAMTSVSWWFSQTKPWSKVQPDGDVVAALVAVAGHAFELFLVRAPSAPGRPRG